MKFAIFFLFLSFASMTFAKVITRGNCNVSLSSPWAEAKRSLKEALDHRGYESDKTQSYSLELRLTELESDGTNFKYLAKLVDLQEKQEMLHANGRVLGQEDKVISERPFTFRIYHCGRDFMGDPEYCASEFAKALVATFPKCKLNSISPTLL